MHISLNSDNCDIKMEISSVPEYIYMWRAIIFTTVMIIATMAGIIPLFKVIFTDDISILYCLSENALLFNLLIDVIISMVNISFSLKIYENYYELFMALTMFCFLSMLVKMRIFMSYVE